MSFSIPAMLVCCYSVCIYKEIISLSKKWSKLGNLIPANAGKARLANNVSDLDDSYILMPTN